MDHLNQEDYDESSFDSSPTNFDDVKLTKKEYDKLVKSLDEKSKMVSRQAHEIASMRGLAENLAAPPAYGMDYIVEAFEPLIEEKGVTMPEQENFLTTQALEELINKRAEALIQEKLKQWEDTNIALIQEEHAVKNRVYQAEKELVESQYGDVMAHNFYSELQKRRAEGTLSVGSIGEIADSIVTGIKNNINSGIYQPPIPKNYQQQPMQQQQYSNQVRPPVIPTGSQPVNNNGAGQQLPALRIPTDEEVNRSIQEEINRRNQLLSATKSSTYYNMLKNNK